MLMLDVVGIVVESRLLVECHQPVTFLCIMGSRLMGY